MAQGYYETALRASEEIIQSGNYALYQELEDPSENFANLFLDKSSNSEMIFVKDYLENGRTHGFTFEVMPRSLREDNTSGGKLNPSLNLVQTFEDRKSTRLNSSHVAISYAVFCLKKK